MRVQEIGMIEGDDKGEPKAKDARDGG